MEIEQRTPIISKKLCSIIRTILYMMKKNISKNISWFELQVIIKHHTKTALKALETLLLDQQTLANTLTCKPNNIHTTFIQPRDYEFSFDNTPLFNPKRKNNHNRYYRGSRKEHEMNVNNVKRVFDILNDYETVSFDHHEVEQSPLTWLEFGDQGKNVRQLRVTDSPFPVNGNEDDQSGVQVDKAADEFIKNFYKELKSQKKRAALEPPSPSPSRYQRWSIVR